MDTKIRPLKKYVRVARTELLILGLNLFSNQNQMIRFFKNQLTKSFDSDLKIFESESFDSNI